MATLNPMFTGIIETTSRVLSWDQEQQTIKLSVQRPEFFNDIKIGDSIAVNGACLTVEALTQSTMSFALAYESQQVLGLAEVSWFNQLVNLERSLKIDSRIDGHLVTGHIDGLVTVENLAIIGESWIFTFKIPQIWQPFIWPKGSCALHGVSLTINQVKNDTFTVCLIPETLKRTNLGDLKVGDQVHLEVDNMARGLVYNLQRMMLYKDGESS